VSTVLHIAFFHTAQLLWLLLPVFVWI